jgi:exodeoxyribonuclease VII large subunit
LALKTPTAVADFLNNHLADEEQKTIRVIRALEKAVQNRMDHEKQELEYVLKDIGGAVTWIVRRHTHELEMQEQRIMRNNPLTLLKKGYSLTLAGGKTLTDVKDVRKGDKITTLLYKGSMEATIDTIKKE